MSTLDNQATGLDDCAIDPAVIAELPKDCKIVSIKRHGFSFWTYTGRIDIQPVNSQPQAYFIKLVCHGKGYEMVRGEYESMKAIHATSPYFAPKPLAWGTCVEAKNTHFFLCEYRDMSGHKPDPHDLGHGLASLHRESISPTGKFGFHVTTYSGNLPQRNDWESSWEVFFAGNMRCALDHEIRAKGRHPEFETLVPVLFDRVIPRLLRPLETGGRVVKPALVHGDLWYANSGVDVPSNEPLIFDACSFYAHNEYEFGQWRPTCNGFGPEYLTAYHAYNEISEPREDYDGRLDLYKLRFNTHVSALFPDNQHLRDQMLNDMRDLIGRYGS
ncbi:Fructosamine kinase-domain-containing protein [Aspergillus avenaceus]|uniref:protein-ribulosamine 3-kinase n=1 Tax=Aspergillus avenaceus TaxID=36643 RepID=A0A5N6TT53_ASPAV|nr:Fructosamine kinase-domain-containing protein [Aspergillus avenaceus]